MKVEYIVLCYLGVAQGKAQWARFEKAFMEAFKADMCFIYVPDHHPNWMEVSYERVSQARVESPNALLIQIAHSAGLATLIEYQSMMLSTRASHQPSATFMISPPVSAFVDKIARLTHSINLNPRSSCHPLLYYLHASLTRIKRLSGLKPLPYHQSQEPIFILYGALDLCITGGGLRISRRLQQLGLTPACCIVTRSRWPLHNPFRWTPQKLADQMKDLFI